MVRLDMGRLVVAVGEQEEEGVDTEGGMGGTCRRHMLATDAAATA